MKLLLKSSSFTSAEGSGCEICDVITELNLPAEVHQMFTCPKQKKVMPGWLLMKLKAISIAADHCEICDEIAELNLPAEAHDTFTCAKQKRGSLDRRSACSGESDDLRALPPARGADGKPPFFALAKVASTNASSRLNRSLLWGTTAELV